MKRLSCICLLGAMLLAETSLAATFTIINQDAAGLGLNDAAAFTPVGGNTATTLGQARLNVLAEAGRIWGLRLGSTQPIVVEARMQTQACTTTSAVLATAGPVTYFTSNAEPNVLVPAALTDALSGSNVNSRNDINVTINSAIGSGPSCLGGRSFYLGFDHNTGGNVDLLNVLLHEFGHGLGFVSLTNSTGAPVVAGKFSSFEQRLYSETLGKFWPTMTDSERVSAGISNGALVFNGPAVNAQSSRLTAGLSSPGGRLRLYAPSTYDSGSSVSHWDTVASYLDTAMATRSLLMEPFITANPLGATDLTGCVMQDMGWPSARCPDFTGGDNTPPLAFGRTVNVIEDTSVAILLTGNDADGSGLLTYSIVSNPTRGALTPPASLTSATGVTFVYAPGANLNGADSFTFQVSDGQALSTPATVTINVMAVNDAPVATPQVVSVQSGQSLAITLSGTDVDLVPGTALTYTVVSNPVSGTLSGSAPALSYTPNASFTGSDSVQFRVNDGTLNSATASISITVTAPPMAASSSGGGGGSFDPAWLVLLGLLRAGKPRNPQ